MCDEAPNAQRKRGHYDQARAVRSAGASIDCGEIQHDFGPLGRSEEHRLREKPLGQSFSENEEGRWVSEAAQRSHLDPPHRSTSTKEVHHAQDNR